MIQTVVPREGLLFVHLQHTMHNGNVSSLYVKHNNVSSSDRLAMKHGEEQNVSALKGWRHALAKALCYPGPSSHSDALPQHDDNGALIVRENTQALPQHVCCQHDGGKVQGLQEQLANRSAVPSNPLAHLQDVHPPQAFHSFCQEGGYV